MPFQNESKVISKAFTTVMDIAPTFLEIAGGKYPSLYEGRPLAPYQGESMLPLLTTQKDHVHDENYVMGWELFGRCALRKGKWKIYKIEPPFGKGAFELFNLEEDPTESNDLSAKFPEIYKDMLNHWNDYVKENGVILLQE
jgi:arylsulfatase